MLYRRHALSEGVTGHDHNDALTFDKDRQDMEIAGNSAARNQRVAAEDHLHIDHPWPVKGRKWLVTPIQGNSTSGEVDVVLRGSTRA